MLHASVLLLCGATAAFAEVMTFTLHTTTHEFGNTGGQVAVRFLVEGAWTDGYVLGSANLGQVLSQEVEFEEHPSKLEFYFADGSTDAWGFSKVELGCWTLLEDPNGLSGTPYPGSATMPWWIDGDEDAPPSIELNVPGEGAPCGGAGKWIHLDSDTCEGPSTIACSAGSESACQGVKPGPLPTYGACTKRFLANMRWGTYFKGCWTWLIIMIIALIASKFAKFKDPTLAPSLVFMAVVCMFVMWTITYFMQINPLLQPIIVAE